MRTETIKKSIGTLGVLFIGFVILLLAAFQILWLYVYNQGAAIITEVGEHYVASLSDQISLHFNTIVDLNFSELSQVAGQLRSIQDDQEVVLEALNLFDETSHYQSVAFYTEDQVFIDLYGPSFTPAAQSIFDELVINGENDISAGLELDGTRIILFAVPVDLFFDQQHVISLVCTLSSEYFVSTLNLENSLYDATTYIIRKDGSFAIRTNNQVGLDVNQNFFNMLENPDNLASLRQLREAIDQNENYSATFYTGHSDSWNHLYEIPLPHSNWFLVVLAPFGEVDEHISRLDMVLASSGVLIILFITASVGFLIFYSKRNINTIEQELNKTRQKSERLSARLGMYEQMSFSIRMPLEKIVSMIRISKNGQPSSSDLRKLENLGTLLLSQIDRANELSAPSAGEVSVLEPLSLSEIASKAAQKVQLILELKNQSAEFILENTSEEIYADGKVLEQLLLDLVYVISDLLKAEEQIRIHIGTKLLKSGLVRVTIRSQAEDSQLKKPRPERSFAMESLEDYVYSLGGSLEIKEGDGWSVKIHLELEPDTLPE